MVKIFGRERGLFSRKQKETKERIEPAKSEKDILIDARIDMHNSLYEKNNKYGGPEKWPEEVRKEFDERKKKIDDAITKIENKEE